MNLKTLFAAAQAQILWADPAHDTADILHVVAADLMSDVLMMDLEQIGRATCRDGVKI